MRIWSLHPKYLDAKGLVALWRETLLAKKVLKGETVGYKNHPQLLRFKKSGNPINAINQYLSVVYLEATTRNYNFNKDKIDWDFEIVQLTVNKGQIDYEFEHLMKKLFVRDKEKYFKLLKEKTIEPHPLFAIIEGEIENWEVLK
jgi:hypothetical protein